MNTPAGDPRRAQAEQIKNAGERASALTRQLLTLGRRQALEPVVLDVDDVIAPLEPMLRRLIRADVELVIARAPHAARVRADRSQLEQVLVNLSVNAGDAMADTGGRLTIATEHATLDDSYFRLHPVAAGEPGAYVVLDVSDALPASQGRTVLLVTDTVLPGPGGIELAARVRARHPGIPTLMMSGYSDAVATHDGPLAPGTEFIAKPFTQADLSAKLTALLGHAGTALDASGA